MSASAAFQELDAVFELLGVLLEALEADLPVVVLLFLELSELKG